MRKTGTILMLVLLMAVAIVMYAYWQGEAQPVTKGVLVTAAGVF